MKKTTLIIIVYLIAIPCIAQSYLGLSIGTDFAQVREAIANRSIKISNSGYSASSFTFGLKGEQHLAKRFSLEVNLSYTKKCVNADYLWIIDFADLTKIEFDYFRNSILGKWYTKQNWYVGLGVSLNYRAKAVDHFYEMGYEFTTPSIFIMSYQKDFGFQFSTGYKHRNFLIDLYLNKAVLPSRKKLKDLKPITSFGISAAYFIKIGKKK